MIIKINPQNPQERLLRQAVAALLDVSATRLTREELDRMAGMIEKAKREGK